MNIELEQSSFIRELNSFLENPLSPFMEKKVKNLLSNYMQRNAPPQPVKTITQTKYIYRTQTIKLKPVQSEVHISINDIIDVVESYLNVGKGFIKNKKRLQEVVYARSITYYFSRKYTYHTLKYIAMQITGADHTSVLHCINSIIRRMDYDDRIVNDVNAIDAIIREKFRIKINPETIEMPEFEFSEKERIVNNHSPMKIAK
jgi:hypothetical protein